MRSLTRSVYCLLFDSIYVYICTYIHVDVSYMYHMCLSMLQPFRVMPWFSWVFIQAIKSSNLRFATDEKYDAFSCDIVVFLSVVIEFS